MKRNRRLALAGLGLLMLAPGPVRADTRPNVVLIVCDDLNTDIGHLDSHPQAHTPNMDKLARSGVFFRHAYSNNPVCAPSRASFLTGKDRAHVRLSQHNED
ncbi:MAG: sulfatase-like hydrolase/transferase [Verrucomicrobia bacterium]|jgi:iduronate 2-sulfatase|nr:sulfatase-like hydrolase/transferase [Verrucomicrobiota bacterium]